VSNEQQIKETTKLVWGASPAGTAYAEGHTKGTKEFFTSVINKRFTQECDWLDEIVGFQDLKNKKVLEIGCGAGYDAYQFLKHGSDYTGIDITPDNPIITKQHLAFCGYQARTFEMDAENMHFDETFDFIFSFGVLHHTPNMNTVLRDIRALLTDDGLAQIIVYHKYSIFYMLHVVLFDWIMRGKFLKLSLADRRSLIEYTESNGKPLVNVYGKKELHALCKKVGFNILKTDIRKLVREDLPDIPLVRSLYRFIPNSWLKFLGNYFGWYISVRLVKA